jgi:hypothetical protein
MYILVIRNHLDSRLGSLCIHKGFHFGQTLFREFSNEIETYQDTFETITIFTSDNALCTLTVIIFSIMKYLLTKISKRHQECHSKREILLGNLFNSGFQPWCRDTSVCCKFLRQKLQSITEIFLYTKF